MQILKLPTKSPHPPLHKGGDIILALGAESAGNFSLSFRPRIIRGRNPLYMKVPISKGFLSPSYSVRNDKKNIHFSDDFGDLLNEKNFKKFQKAILDYLKKNKIKPNIILTDLHPLYKTTLWGAKLAKKYKAKHVQVQHHLAHIFSAIEEKIINDTFYGIALDGTGYGLDGKIWGGEVFKISNFKFQISNKIQNPKSKKLNISRIGHLENQTMIGGDLAIQEPARMLISILSKILPKGKIYGHVKKYYTKNQFELLYNQLQNNFNCVETSSTGRVLDAVSVLLGFNKNKRSYKHEPVYLLEKNSTKPYKINPKLKTQNSKLILDTTYLFKYLIKNLHRDKKCLAATAQLYIAQGLYKIINKKQKFFLAGGIASNKIISSFLESKGAYKNKTIPRGDAGVSFGQIIYYLNIKK